MASAEPYRELDTDFTFEPPRYTAKAVYRIDAADEDGAEREASERFAADQLDAGISGPETVLAAVEYLSYPRAFQAAASSSAGSRPPQRPSD